MAEASADQNTAVSAPAEPQPNFDLSSYTPDQHREWMETGKIPTLDPDAKSGPGANEDDTTSQAGESEDSKPAAESATAPKQEKKAPAAHDADSRIKELLRERATLRDRLAALEKPAEKPAESAPAKPAESKLERPKRPTFGESGHEEETWAQYEDRLDAHSEALVQYGIAASEQKKAEAKAESDRKAEAAKVAEGWQERVLEATTKYADYADVAFSASTPINPTMQAFLLEHPQGAEVLYRLGENGSAEGKRIHALPPMQALTELAKIALSLEEPATTEPAKPPAKPITKAARPATELRATNSAPANPLHDAVERDDQEEFNRLRNSRKRA